MARQPANFLHNQHASNERHIDTCPTRDVATSHNNHFNHPTMSTPLDEPKIHSNRRSVKRFKHGGSQQPLSHQARSSISQLLRNNVTAQAPPDTDLVSLNIGAYHDAPLKGRMHKPYVFRAVGTRGSLDNNCIYTYHPNSRLDLKNPLSLTTTNTDSSPDLLNTTATPTTRPPTAPSPLTSNSPTPAHKTSSTSSC